MSLEWDLAALWRSGCTQNGLRLRSLRSLLCRARVRFSSAFKEILPPPHFFTPPPPAASAAGGVARTVVAATATATAANRNVRCLIEGAPLLYRLEPLNVTRYGTTGRRW